MPPDPYAPPFVQQVPFVDIAKKIFPLFVIERLHEVGQDSRVPEPQQGATAIRQPHVELQLQQLREAIQVLRRDQQDMQGTSRSSVASSSTNDSSTLAASTSQGPA